MENLASKKCIPCEGGVAPLLKEQADPYLAQVLGWKLSDDGKKISREFEFKDFKGSMAFINKVADVAEAEGHHPDIFVFYDKVRMELWTHAIGGLSKNDFIMAAKINQLLS